MSSAVKVLVVEDDSDSRILLETILTSEGYAVLLAANGAEALAAARDNDPHVILLDLAMPVMDGFAFRAAQLRDPQLANIPVICVSGRHDAHEIARELNLTACLRKPFSLAEIVLRIENVAGESRGHRNPSRPAGGGASV